jgi:hypothetical protein
VRKLTTFTQRLTVDIAFKTTKYPFVPWRPELGKVMTRKFAFDTETTLIDETRPWMTPAYVLGAAFDGTRGVFVPRDRVAAFFQAHDGLPFICHNTAFDLKVVHHLAPELDVYKAVDENRVWDTMLLHQLLALATNGTVAGGKGQATLERLAEKFLGFKLPKGAKDADGDEVRLSYAKWLHQPLNEITQPYLHYLALDVIATHRVYVRLRRALARVLRASRGTWGFVSNGWLREQVRKWGPQTHHIQLKAAVALDAISAPGLHIDEAERGPLAAKLSDETDRLRKELAGHGFLPDGKGSDKALQGIIERTVARTPGLQWPRTAGEKKYATGKDVLQDMAAHVPFVEVLLQHRATSKLRSTFVDKLTAGVIHPRFRTLTRTGRTSSYGQLNVQNLPRAAGVRECFLPSPGHVFLAADYSTIELVTLAQSCEAQFGLESGMAAAIRDGRDLHRLLAARVTGKRPEDVTKDERDKAKPINFGKPGGMGEARLKSYAKASYNQVLSDDEVKSLADAWFAEFPEMREFLRDEREAVWGRTAEALGLTAEDHARLTGDRRFLWHATPASARMPNKFLGAMALKAAADPRPARWRDGQPYPESDLAYFWAKLDAVKEQLHKTVRVSVAKREACYPLKRAVRSFCDRAGVFTLTGRLRAKTGYCQRHNTVFQGLAADGAKLALWKLWRAGLRVVNFVHDEFIVEVREDSDLTAAAAQVEALMVAGMREVVPDLPVKVECAAMQRWSKKAKPKFDAEERLVVWEPKAASEASSSTGDKLKTPAA